MKRAVLDLKGKKNIIDLTAQEVEARKKEGEQNEKRLKEEQPLREWMKEISKLDAVMPRALEDVIDALDVDVQKKIAKYTLDIYNEKKALRSAKPNG